MSDAFTALVVCLSAIGELPDLAQCPHTLLIDDGGFSVNGVGYSLKQCKNRLTYLHLPGDTFKFCSPSPVREDLIDSFKREVTKPNP